MSLNDSILEGDFYNMSNYSARPWQGSSNAPSAPRNKIDSFVGTTVVVVSLDGVPVEHQLMCKLLEVSSKGFLLKVEQTTPDFVKGIIIFSSSCSFKANND